MGVSFGVDGIYTTKTHHKKYYLTANKRNLELLNEVQNSFLKKDKKEKR